MRIIEERPLPGSDSKLEGYLHGPADEFIRREKRPCVVICPGGAYRRLASHEAEPVAMRFYAAGYQAFILYYTVFDIDNPQQKPLGLLPLKELSAAVRLIRSNCREWLIEPDQVTVCGFSAGGHLAASLGVLWDQKELVPEEPHSASNRPDAMVLCYPVISSGEFAHRESIEHLTGRDGDREFFSLEKHVSVNTPPSFLWHTVDDTSVPMENTLLFASALQQHHVPFECHLFGNGLHGLSLCEEDGRVNVHCATWVPLCMEWLSQRTPY